MQTPGWTGADRHHLTERSQPPDREQCKAQFPLLFLKSHSWRTDQKSAVCPSGTQALSQKDSATPDCILSSGVTSEDRDVSRSQAGLWAEEEQNVSGLRTGRVQQWQS